MRESARIERMHLPGDTYQEWLKSQKEEPLRKGAGNVFTQNSFEIWMAKRVEGRIKKAPSKEPWKKPSIREFCIFLCNLTPYPK